MNIRTNVRDGVFETNSSSSHSVTVVPEEVLDFSIPKEDLRNGVLVVRPRGHGLEWYRYHSPQGKLAYLLSQLAPDYLDACPRGEDCAAILRRTHPKAEMAIGAVERVTGCRVEVRPHSRDAQHYLGIYVDPDSRGVGLEMLKDEETLLGFLFSPRSFVETGDQDTGPGDTIPTDLGEVPYLKGAYATARIQGDPLTLVVAPDGALTVTGDGDTVEIPGESYGFVRLRERLADLVVESVEVTHGDAGTPMAEETAVQSFHDFLAEATSYDSPKIPLAEDLVMTGRHGELDPWTDPSPVTLTLSCVVRPGKVPGIMAAAEAIATPARRPA
jgi:hypothetical protein